MDEKSIQVSRIHRVEGDTKLKAFVDILVSGVVIKGLRIVSGKKGLFLSMPQQQGKDGKWYNAVYPVSKEVRNELAEIVLSAYNE